jgi:EAL domain-containing protein (putative c-di-GMP-specific phosphodiesterase class I)/GGDEF domain-containing protein
VTAADLTALPCPAGEPAALPSGPWQGLLERRGHPAALADRQGVLRMVSAAFARRLGRTTVELQGQPVAGLITPEQNRDLQGLLQGMHQELMLPVRADAPPLRLSRLQAADAASAAWLLLELPDQRLERRALEALFRDHGGAVALLHLQLQQLDLVQGKLGLQAGEALLEVLAHRLAGCLPPGALFCREGGDRFLVLLPGDWSPEGALQALDGLLGALEEPLTLSEHVLEPAFHVGVARSPADGSEFGPLHRAATRALELTHKPPVSACRLAEPPERGLQLRERLAGPLAIALEGEGLELAFQPILELESSRLVGAEVLCRWDDPVLGRQVPSDFINVAVATEQISALGRWVVEAALATLAAWDRAGHRLERIGINISALQLEDPHGMPFLREAVVRHGLATDRVVLELAEADVIALSGRAVDHLRDLHRQGFRLAMDDFGTGYSGLKRLTQLPFSQVKVDRSLIAAIDYDPMQQAMLMALVTTAAGSGVDLVAEGIERSRQRQMLQSLGCRYGQGFHLAPPLSAAEMEAALSEPSGRWRADAAGGVRVGEG